ncbi:MAG: hypothetical protein KGJ23_15165 [Euryarchaeota archaeon]|nr:hypothetical protein [Euryarchaeota archaeon]MDE1837940.1 hypothetical protein [Euryarchaeota archaeon]MDE1880184.1 hypothetical protein [Euryarchaeota archaeon]MDE2045401.1 hypothetical protein [Thermoplasmata archaeon]
MPFALDTHVVCTALIDGGDLFWNEWVAFDEAETAPRFVPRAAYDELQRVVEGLGQSTSGRLREILTDTARAIWRSDPARPDSAMVSRLGPTHNRAGRVERMLSFLDQALGENWDSGRARSLLRQMELDYTVRKKSFFDKHEVFEPVDPVQVEKIAASLATVVPSSSPNGSWAEDCLIISQSAAYGIERGCGVELVTQDDRHIHANAVEILKRSGLDSIRDLSGKKRTP